MARGENSKNDTADNLGFEAKLRAAAGALRKQAKILSDVWAA